MSFLVKSLRRIAPVLLLGAAACSQSVPTSPNGVPDQGPTLTLQHAENLRAIAKERAASQARYERLRAQWNSRHDGAMLAATNGTDPFVPCAPLPFDGVAQIVGPDGGVFHFGPHTLTVPAGALSSSISIAVILPSSLKNEVTLLPHGTQFAEPVKLTLAYGNCDPAATHRVAYIDDNANILEWPTSFDFSTAGIVEATLSHFSQYAIAY